MIAPVKCTLASGHAVDCRAPDIRVLVNEDANAYCVSSEPATWLPIMREAFGHKVMLIQAREGEQILGALPLALVKSALFGRFLVSLPYVNCAGVDASSDEVARKILDKAVELADEHDVKYLELRHGREIDHPALTQKNDTKVLMRLALPDAAEKLITGFKSKLRSQIRSGEKHNFDVTFGGHELLAPFYDVFSRNMRDLGTPVYSWRLFAAIFKHVGEKAEMCVVRLGKRPVAAALLVHAREVTEVPSASSLRAFNSTNANMVMYWHLLKRAIERGQKLFDFGRSTIDSNTFRFKKQWGAQPQPSVWQYYVRRGSIDQLRPDNVRFSLAIRAWQHLPVWLTRLIGPAIVRGIP
jgi:serine/alanine adding enzyme